jgi:hypothetical protein
MQRARGGTIILTVDHLHLIAEDLADDTFEEWAADGLRALETYLEKHAAFATFLDSRELNAHS